jgi:hypothetical protein
MKSLRLLSKCLIVIANLITFNVYASNHNNPKDWEFSKDQISVLKHVKQKCNSKGVNGNLCAAIVWHESSAGKNKIGGGSVGNFHNQVSTVVNREKEWKRNKDSRYSGFVSRSTVKSKLLNSVDYEVKHASAQLGECKSHLSKIHKFNNQNMLSCYNGGLNGYKIPAAKTYAKNVLKKKDYLKQKGV